MLNYIIILVIFASSIIVSVAFYLAVRVLTRKGREREQLYKDKNWPNL